MVRGLGIALCAGLALGVAPAAFAQTCATNDDFQTCSSGYGLSETFFGTGGLDTCPTQGGNAYCANMSAGELTVGNTAGTDFQAQAGFNTRRDESLEVNVTKAAVNLGVIDPSSTGFDTAEFNVKSYLSSGYVVQIYGLTPTNGGYSVAATTAPYNSTQGTEQFGLNLVENTTPILGADPVQDADAQNLGSPFGFGGASSPYDTADVFRYTSGDTIAAATQSSGYTYYTISYIMNVSALSPGGTYTTSQSIVVTSTF